MRFFRFLSDYLLLSACCIFLISTLSPFLVVNYPLFYPLREGDSPLPGIIGFTMTYWSYMAISSSGTKVFLNNYWFNNNDLASPSSLGISWIIVAIFLLQVLTLTSAIVSLLRLRKIRIIPFVSSIIIVFLMIQVNLKTSETPFIGPGTYQLGYWLTYVSIILFLSALAFSFAS
jgi:glucan phosphoethanolaminetransferase (alkaline phosphatase superfamily)